MGLQDKIAGELPSGHFQVYSPHANPQTYCRYTKRRSCVIYSGISVSVGTWKYSCITVMQAWLLFIRLWDQIPQKAKPLPLSNCDDHDSWPEQTHDRKRHASSYRVGTSVAWRRGADMTRLESVSDAQTVIQPHALTRKAQSKWGLKAEKTVLKWNLRFTELLCNYCPKILLHHQTMPETFPSTFSLGQCQTSTFASSPH